MKAFEPRPHCVAVRLSDQQLERLERLTQETRQTPSEVLRSLIDTAQTKPVIARQVYAGDLRLALESR